jgi:hypothetical protein
MMKPNMSSPTRGNPYGRTGAPGKSTEPKPEQPRFTEADAARALGQPPPAPTPQERTLAAAPPPRPQMPNLNALKMRGMQGQGGRPPMAGMNPPGMPPTPPPQAPMPMPQQQAPQPMPDPRLAQLYGQYGIR